MSVKYDKLFALMQAKGIKKYDLRQNGIYAAVVDKLIKNANVDVTTINKLCKLLNCQPGDIMEYIPDKSDDKAKNIKPDFTENNTSTADDTPSTSDSGSVSNLQQDDNV
jgi:DNA-binding Xre family transcriptional regulator